MHSPSLPRRARRIRVLAVFGFCGLAFFVAVVVLLPLFRPEYSSFREPLSALLIGRYGYVQTAALFAAGLGSFAVTVGLYTTMRASRWSRLGCGLLGVWALCIALAGILPTDAEGRPYDAARTFHGVVALLAFMGAVAGILVLSKVFERDARWRSFYPLSLALGFAALVGLVDLLVVIIGLLDLASGLSATIRSMPQVDLATFIRSMPQRFDGFLWIWGLGVIQRIFIGTVILWMMLAATRLYSLVGGGRGTTPR